jgi:hypothetical protein
MTMEQWRCLGRVPASLFSEVPGRRAEGRAQASFEHANIPRSAGASPCRERQERAGGSQPPVVRDKGLELSRTTAGDSPLLRDCGGWLFRLGGLASRKCWRPQVPPAADPDGGAMDMTVNDQVPAAGSSPSSTSKGQPALDVARRPAGHRGRLRGARNDRRDALLGSSRAGARGHGGEEPLS